MRIWSLHPKYLDARGLVALWRETLLAKHVLEGRTTGYKNHPQLNRFKSEVNPVSCINQYLETLYEESLVRNYNFDKNKIAWNYTSTTMEVTNGQLKYERMHLLSKLKIRDFSRFDRLKNQFDFEVHPIFKAVPGSIAEWEVVE